MKEVLADARRGAVYVIPTAALIGLSVLAFGPEVLLAIVVSVLLFAVCVLIGLIVE